MDTRARIVEAADNLFYRRGFEYTSFKDIADEVGLSRGNFYYHFKLKDDLLEAVIGRRLDNTQIMLEQWESQTPDPGGRIRCFVKILTANWAKIRLYGCPVGTLTSELSKLDHPARAHAGKVFTLFRRWLKHQFELMGQSNRADELAMHVLAFSQGVATVASTYRDRAFVEREVERMCQWLAQYEPDSN